MSAKQLITWSKKNWLEKCILTITFFSEPDHRDKTSKFCGFNAAGLMQKLDFLLIKYSNFICWNPLLYTKNEFDRKSFYVLYKGKKKFKFGVITITAKNMSVSMWS